MPASPAAPASSYDLRGKTALVTGASRGLGRAMAIKLASCGAKTAVNYFGSADLAAGVVKSIADAGGVAHAFKADVTEEADVAKLCTDVKAMWGPIDILVVNATGDQPHIPIEQLNWDLMMDQLVFFVKSPLLLLQNVLADMKSRRSGRVINIGSEVFEKGVPEFSNYVSAKGAQLGLTRSWAMELAPFQITVNTVHPGWIPTERHDNDAQEDKDAYARSVPMGRMGEHADIADAVAFLASDAANFITGQKLSVNGGNSLE